MGNIFMRLSQDMADKGSIDRKYADLYGKAAELCIMMILNFAAALLMGAVMNMWWETVVMLGAMIPLRSYVGGYHAKNYFRCFLQSMAVTFTAICSMKYCMENSTHAVGMVLSFLGAFLVIVLCAPAADANRRITEAEKEQYRIRAIVIAVIEGTAAMILQFLHNHFSYAIMASVVICAVALIMQCIKKLAVSENVEKDELLHFDR